ncbi:MAG: phytanoyl-CoA dioxygenase family protein [Microthrixaceae bacterium]
MRTHVRRLRSRRLDRRLARDGFVVVRAIQPESVRRALDVYEANPSGVEEGYYASIHSSSRTYKEQVDLGLRPILWPPLDDLLVDHRCLVAAMMVKPPRGNTEVPVHQDWNVIDEVDGAGLTCWMPLTPVTELEGLMRVVPGSHRLPTGLRGSPGFPSPYTPLADQLQEECMVDVEVGVGDVMIMDGRVLHTTGPNRSGRHRIAAYLNVIPAQAQPLHYYMSPDGQVEKFEVELPFFTSFQIGDRPDGKLVEVIDRYEPPTVTIEDVRGSNRRRSGLTPSLH